MRKTLMTTLVVLAIAMPAGIVFAEHGQGPREAACVGARSGGRCDVLYSTFSVESRRGENTTSCPHSTSSQPECYRDYTHSRDSDAAWGPDATEAVVPGTAVGPLTFGGIYNSGVGAPNGRVWTGVAGEGAGAGSIGAGGAIDAANTEAYGCVTAYGADDTDGHVIATQTNAAQGHENDDFETDLTFCGEAGNGV